MCLCIILFLSFMVKENQTILNWSKAILFDLRKKLSLIWPKQVDKSIAKKDLRILLKENRIFRTQLLLLGALHWTESTQSRDFVCCVHFSHWIDKIYLFICLLHFFTAHQLIFKAVLSARRANLLRIVHKQKPNKNDINIYLFICLIFPVFVCRLLWL